VGNKSQFPTTSPSKISWAPALTMLLITLDLVSASHGSSSHSERTGCGFTGLRGRDKGEAKMMKGDRARSTRRSCISRWKGGCKGAIRHWPLINFFIVGESFNIKDDLIETRVRGDGDIHARVIPSGRILSSCKLAELFQLHLNPRKITLWICQQAGNETEEDRVSTFFLGGVKFVFGKILANLKCKKDMAKTSLTPPKSVWQTDLHQGKTEVLISPICPSGGDT
ncbi:unnamed protein product, partial [Bubo scandiacus]